MVPRERFYQRVEMHLGMQPQGKYSHFLLALNTSHSGDLTGLYLTRLLHSNSSHLKWTVALLGSISNRWTSLAALNCYGDSGRGHLGTALLICHKKILEGGNVSCRWKV